MTYAPEGRVIFDADSHLMEPSTWLAEYAPPAVAAALLPLDLGDGDYATMAKIEEEHAKAARILDDGDLMKVKGWDAIGAYDPGQRARALDLLGFDRQLVFPTFAPTQFRSRDLSLLYGGASALTAGMAAFCATDERLLAVGFVPLEDPERALAATLEAIDLGCAAVLVPSVLPSTRSPSHLALMPVWRVLAEAGVPFVLHVDGTEPIVDPVVHRTDRPVSTSMFGGGEHLKAKDYMGIGMLPEIFLSTMILDGVFDELPDLRAASVEQGAMWVVPWLRRLDIAQDTFGRNDATLKALSLRASDYVRRQIRFTPFPTEPVDWLIEQAGDELFMFSTDYPHLEGGRDPLGRFEKSLAGVSQRARDRFYSENFGGLVGALPTREGAGR